MKERRTDGHALLLSHLAANKEDKRRQRPNERPQHNIPTHAQSEIRLLVITRVTKYVFWCALRIAQGPIANAMAVQFAAISWCVYVYVCIWRAFRVFPGRPWRRTQDSVGHLTDDKREKKTSLVN